MFNMNNKKTQRKIATAIAIILILAMVVPMAVSFIG